MKGNLIFKRFSHLSNMYCTYFYIYLFKTPSVVQNIQQQKGRLIRKDLEERGCVLISGPIPTFALKD
jgi:hypothetical protein